MKLYNQAKDEAIETMRKYQKILHILNWENYDSIENAKYHTEDIRVV